MTSLERRGNAIAFAFTAFFFLAFLIFSLAVKFKPQEKFQVLTINLASFPVEKKSLQETTLQKKDVPSKNQSSKDVEKIKPVEPKKIPEEKSSSQKNKIVKNGLPVSSEKQKEVRLEPRLALDGGEDGYDFYREIVNRWSRKLKKGGALAFELGEGQADTVKALMTDKGFSNFKISVDFGGVQRAIIGTLL